MLQVFTGKHFSGPAKAGEHLVGNTKHASVFCITEHAIQHIGTVYSHATGCLHQRFVDKAGHVVLFYHRPELMQYFFFIFRPREIDIRTLEHQGVKGTGEWYTYADGYRPKL